MTNIGLSALFVASVPIASLLTGCSGEAVVGESQDRELPATVSPAEDANTPPGAPDAHVVDVDADAALDADDPFPSDVSTTCAIGPGGRSVVVPSSTVPIGGELQLIGVLGRPGRDPGEFDFEYLWDEDDSSRQGVLALSDTDLYVADIGNARVHRFDLSSLCLVDMLGGGSAMAGNYWVAFRKGTLFLAQWGPLADEGYGVVVRAMSIDMGSSGTDHPMRDALEASHFVGVDDAQNAFFYWANRVSKIPLASGRVSREFGELGTGPGELNTKNRASSLVVSPTNEVFVLDAGNARIQRFSNDGEFRSAFAVNVDPGGRGARMSSDGNALYYIDDDGSLIQTSWDGQTLGSWSFPSRPARVAPQSWFAVSSKFVFVLNVARGRVDIYAR